MVSGIFSTFGRMFIEKTPWKVRKNSEYWMYFPSTCAKSSKNFDYLLYNACHLYKTDGRPKAIILNIIMLQA